MEPIRLATKEEIEAIRSKSDLEPGCTVFALTGKSGTDLAVVRNITEIDPMFFDVNAPDSRKAMFIWGLENMLRMVNVPFYYFNVPTNEEAAPWRSVVEKWGADKTSLEPEFRYKKVLL